MKVSVRELKKHLSAYLRRAHDGEEITVTSYGRRVARLAKPLAESATPMSVAIERPRAEPWLAQPEKPGKSAGLKEPIRPTHGMKTFAETIAEDRG
jgi:antitoxin (DNA-binding transcriptional repressor) of toxin-antitoxin stability system